MTLQGILGSFSSYATQAQLEGMSFKEHCPCKRSLWTIFSTYAYRTYVSLTTQTNYFNDSTIALELSIREAEVQNSLKTVLGSFETAMVKSQTEFFRPYYERASQDHSLIRSLCCLIVNYGDKALINAFLVDSLWLKLDSKEREEILGKDSWEAYLSDENHKENFLDHINKYEYGKALRLFKTFSFTPNFQMYVDAHNENNSYPVIALAGFIRYLHQHKEKNLIHQILNDIHAKSKDIFYNSSGIVFKPEHESTYPYHALKIFIPTQLAALDFAILSKYCGVDIKKSLKHPEWPYKRPSLDGLDLSKEPNQSDIRTLLVKGAYYWVIFNTIKKDIENDLSRGLWLKCFKKALFQYVEEYGWRAIDSTYLKNDINIDESYNTKEKEAILDFFLSSEDQFDQQACHVLKTLQNEHEDFALLLLKNYPGLVQSISEPIEFARQRGWLRVTREFLEVKKELELCIWLNDLPEKEFIFLPLIKHHNCILRTDSESLKKLFLQRFPKDKLLIPIQRDYFQFCLSTVKHREVRPQPQKSEEDCIKDCDIGGYLDILIESKNTVESHVQKLYNSELETVENLSFYRDALIILFNLGLDLQKRVDENNNTLLYHVLKENPIENRVTNNNNSKEDNNNIKYLAFSHIDEFFKAMDRRNYQGSNCWNLISSVKLPTLLEIFNKIPFASDYLYSLSHEAKVELRMADNKIIDLTAALSTKLNLSFSEQSGHYFNLLKDLIESNCHEAAKCIVHSIPNIEEMIYYLLQFHRDLDVLKCILTSGARWNRAYSDSYCGGNFLHWCVYWSLKDFVKPFVKAGVSLGAHDSRGLTPLQNAVRDGNLIMVNAILEAAKEPGSGYSLFLIGYTDAVTMSYSSQQEIRDALYAVKQSDFAVV